MVEQKITSFPGNALANVNFGIFNYFRYRPELSRVLNRISPVPHKNPTLDSPTRMNTTKSFSNERCVRPDCNRKQDPTFGCTRLCAVQESRRLPGAFLASLPTTESSATNSKGACRRSCKPHRVVLFAVVQCCADVYQIAPGLKRSDKSVALLAAPNHGYPFDGSTPKISCMVCKVDE